MMIGHPDWDAKVADLASRAALGALLDYSSMVVVGTHFAFLLIVV